MITSSLRWIFSCRSARERFLIGSPARRFALRHILCLTCPDGDSTRQIFCRRRGSSLPPGGTQVLTVRSLPMSERNYRDGKPSGSYDLDELRKNLGYRPSDLPSRPDRVSPPGSERIRYDAPTKPSRGATPPGSNRVRYEAPDAVLPRCHAPRSRPRPLRGPDAEPPPHAAPAGPLRRV